MVSRNTTMILMSLVSFNKLLTFTTQISQLQFIGTRSWGYCNICVNYMNDMRVKCFKQTESWKSCNWNLIQFLYLTFTIKNSMLQLFNIMCMNCKISVQYVHYWINNSKSQADMCAVKLNVSFKLIINYNFMLTTLCSIEGFNDTLSLTASRYSATRENWKVKVFKCKHLTKAPFKLLQSQCIHNGKCST